MDRLYFIFAGEKKPPKLKNTELYLSNKTVGHLHNTYDRSNKAVKTYLRFLHYLYEKHAILHWINNN